MKNPFKKLIELIKSAIWVVSMATKPDRSDYMSVAKLGILLTLGVGIYAFILSIIRYLLFTPGAIASLPYPLNTIIPIVIATLLFLIVLYLIKTFSWFNVIQI